jgi:hypothetical protein
MMSDLSVDAHDAVGSESHPVSHDNPADMMTKPVPIAKFELCSSLVGITV